MKKFKGFLASAMMLALLFGISPQQTKAAPPVSVSFQFFYDNLSPYGAWVSYESYGFVWIPRASGFRPYCSGGHWVFTDAGWMWASNYDWGWAPFHYGSWMYDPYYGWLWVPGYTWAPAWVTWGYYDGYYGWAPLSPGISFSVSYYPPINYWVFTSPRYMTVNNFSNNYYVYSGNRIPLGGNTSITNVKSINVVDNTGGNAGKRYSVGPAKSDFEKAANTKLTAAAIRDNDKPGKTNVSGKSISIYRPGVDDSDRKTAKPSKVVPLESMKRSDVEGKANESGKIRGRDAEKKAAPQHKNDVKEKEPQRERKPEMKEQPRQPKPETNEQPKERKPEMKEQPKQQERKPEMKREQPKERKPEMQPPREQRREVAPLQRQQRMQPEARPPMERQTPKQNNQPQQRQPREKHNPK